MCIAAISKEGGFTEQELKAFFDSNRDGGGYSYVQDGQVVNIRHITDVAEYVSTGLSLSDKKNLVTHCRIATAGAVNEDNAHPFDLGGASLVHNGHLFYNGGYNGQGPSDTFEFVRDTKKHLVNEEKMTEEVIKGLGSIIGSYNKLIILYPSEKFVIINEAQGYWRENKWYSNLGWEYNMNRSAAAPF